MSLIAELKRRNVFKVGIAYVVASWLLLQLTEVLTELLEIGPEVGKIVIVLLIVGFVPALIFAWAFEMTPEGIKREHEVDRTQSVTQQTGRKLDFTIIGIMAVALGYFVWESRFQDDVTPGSSSVSQKTAIQDNTGSRSVTSDPSDLDSNNAPSTDASASRLWGGTRPEPLFGELIRRIGVIDPPPPSSMGKFSSPAIAHHSPCMWVCITSPDSLRITC